MRPTESDRRVPEIRTAFPSEPVRTPIRHNVPHANSPDRFGRMNVGVSTDQLIDEYKNFALDSRVREMRTAAPGTPLLDSPRPRRRVSEMRTAQPVNQPISQLELRIDNRLESLEADSYDRPESGYSRDRYQRLLQQRASNRVGAMDVDDVDDMDVDQPFDHRVRETMTAPPRNPKPDSNYGSEF